MVRWQFALLALLSPLCASAQRPPAVVPERPDTVIERLPRGYSVLAPRTTAPADPAAQANALLATAARTGDGRLVARAQALIDRHPAAKTRPDLLRAAAYAAQYRHDFATALRLLDQAVRIDPRDADARLARAQIHLVQGRLDRAHGECTALALGVSAEHGLVCVAALSLRRGELDRAAALLDRSLARPGTGRDLQRHMRVMRAETASRQGDPRADAWFARALAAAPGDVRTLAAYSRHLRAQRRFQDAYRLLENAPATDHLLLERALSARALGHARADALEAGLADRFAAARALGSEPDLHDEAEFLLTLKHRPAAALELAARNFAEQRDYEDVDLMRRAALAARQPEAWRTVQEWAQSQRLVVPAFTGERS